MQPKSKNETAQKIFERIKKESNKEVFVSLCESNTFESYTPSSRIPVNVTNSKLARTLFPVKNTKQIT